MKLPLASLISKRAPVHSVRRRTTLHVTSSPNAYRCTPSSRRAVSTRPSLLPHLSNTWVRGLQTADSSERTATASESGSKHGEQRTLDLDITNADGSSTRVQVRPTRKANISLLAAQLPPLLSRGKVPGIIMEATFGTTNWIVDELGEAIHRHFAVGPELARTTIDRINTIADAMNHHPHINKQNCTSGSEQLVHFTVTCTTHNPKGLGMRDVKLARAINSMLESYQSSELLLCMDDTTQDSILKEKQAQIRRNMESASCAVCK